VLSMVALLEADEPEKYPAFSHKLAEADYLESEHKSACRTVLTKRTLARPRINDGSAFRFASTFGKTFDIVHSSLKSYIASCYSNITSIVTLPLDTP
jgi:hypothetical protein